MRPSPCRHLPYRVYGRRYTRYVSCLQREGLMKVHARVVSAESGQVLGSVDRPLPIKVKHCEDEEGGLPTQQSVAEASSHDLAEAIANYLAPHFELREFELEKIRRSEEHTSELQSLAYLVCRLL